MIRLPFQIAHAGVPPIKCQGIKTKLIAFIFSSVQWEAGADSCWIEPFLGSGVVALNLAPERALLADTNRHIIGFYQALQVGEINRHSVREFLECEGRKLASGGADYYYEVRERFNAQSSPFDFLFLSRACFNGVIRFNRQGKFNVPFGHKPVRNPRCWKAAGAASGGGVESTQPALCVRQAGECPQGRGPVPGRRAAPLAENFSSPYLRYERERKTD